jgi:hypothetical protein
MAQQAADVMWAAPVAVIDFEVGVRISAGRAPARLLDHESGVVLEG